MMYLLVGGTAMRRYRYSGPAPSRRCIPGKKGIAVESEPARERTRDSEMPDVENQPRKEGGEVEVAGTNGFDTAVEGPRPLRCGRRGGRAKG